MPSLIVKCIKCGNIAEYLNEDLLCNDCQFLKDTKKLIDENTDLEVALSRMDGDEQFRKVEEAIREQIDQGILCPDCLKYIDTLESERCECDKENDK